MDDFLFLPERYAGYPLTIVEAQQAYTRGRYSALDWEMLPPAEQRTQIDQSASYFWWKLASSHLHAFVQAPETGAWYRVPASYWIDHRGGLVGAISATDLPSHIEQRPFLKPVLAAVLGQPVVLWKEDVLDMLGGAAAEAEVLMSLMRALTPSSLASEHLGEPVVDDAVRHRPSSTERIKQVAAQLDAAGIPKRQIRSADIAKLWAASWGAQPSREEVRGEMTGKTGGRHRRN